MLILFLVLRDERANSGEKLNIFSINMGGGFCNFLLIHNSYGKITILKYKIQ